MSCALPQLLRAASGQSQLLESGFASVDHIAADIMVFAAAQSFRLTTGRFYKSNVTGRAHSRPTKRRLEGRLFSAASCAGEASAYRSPSSAAFHKAQGGGLFPGPSVTSRMRLRTRCASVGSGIREAATVVGLGADFGPLTNCLSTAHARTDARS